MTDVKHSSGTVRFFTLVMGYVLVLVPFFQLLETMKSIRSSQWTPDELFHSPPALALLLYCLIVGGVGCVVTLLFALIQRAIPHKPSAIACLSGLTGTTIWSFIRAYRDSAPTLSDNQVVIAILVLCVGQYIALRLFRLTPLTYGVSVAVAGFYAAFCFYTHAAWHIFTPDRVGLSLREPGLYIATVTVIVGCIALVFFRVASRKRQCTGLVLLLVLLIVAMPVTNTGMGDAPGHTADERPNLILIVSDTMRADYLSLYGGDVPTPNLERLANRGAVFNQAHALAPWTLPSVWGMFNSQYPAGLTPNVDGVYWVEQIWRYTYPHEGSTLATRMGEQGYDTAAFTANMLLWVLPSAMNGFETAASTHPILLRRDWPLTGYPFLSDALSGMFPRWDNLRPHNTTVDIDSYARQWLQYRKQDPFFLYLHYIDPHAPYDPPEAYRKQSGAWPFFHPYDGGERWGIPALNETPLALPKAEEEYTRSLYEGEIQYMDEFVGRMLDYLEAEGLMENTYICFTSDHGEELWDHGQWGHGQSLYEELLHVPLIFAGPGIAPQKITTPVSAIDLMPTLAHLLDEPPLPNWRGRNLGPVLQGEAGPISATPIFMQGTNNKIPHPQRAVIHEGYKLIQKADHAHRELYHLESDPLEQNNIAAEHPDSVAALDALIADWLTTFPSTYEVNLGEFNPEAVRELEGMGYL